MGISNYKTIRRYTVNRNHPKEPVNYNELLGVIKKTESELSSWRVSELSKKYYLIFGDMITEKPNNSTNMELSWEEYDQLGKDDRLVVKISYWDERDSLRNLDRMDELEKQVQIKYAPIFPRRIDVGLSTYMSNDEKNRLEKILSLTPTNTKK